MPKKKVKRSVPTKTKAKEILKDGTVHGKKLTLKQKKFFGAIVDGTRKK